MPSEKSAIPSENIPFPQNARLTAVELLTFLPNCIRCADAVYRFFANGGTRQGIHSIIRFNRVLHDGEWNINIVGGTLYRTMRKSGFENWTCGIHMRWHTNHVVLLRLMYQLGLLRSTDPIFTQRRLYSASSQTLELIYLCLNAKPC